MPANIPTKPAGDEKRDEDEPTSVAAAANPGDQQAVDHQATPDTASPGDSQIQQEAPNSNTSPRPPLSPGNSHQTGCMSIRQRQLEDNRFGGRRFGREEPLNAFQWSPMGSDGGVASAGTGQLTAGNSGPELPGPPNLDTPVAGNDQPLMSPMAELDSDDEWTYTSEDSSGHETAVKKEYMMSSQRRRRRRRASEMAAAREMEIAAGIMPSNVVPRQPRGDQREADSTLQQVGDGQRTQNDQESLNQQTEHLQAEVTQEKQSRRPSQRVVQSNSPTVSPFPLPINPIPVHQVAESGPMPRNPVGRQDEGNVELPTVGQRAHRQDGPNQLHQQQAVGSQVATGARSREPNLGLLRVQPGLPARVRMEPRGPYAVPRVGLPSPYSYRGGHGDGDSHFLGALPHPRRFVVAPPQLQHGTRLRAPPVPAGVRGDSTATLHPPWLIHQPGPGYNGSSFQELPEPNPQVQDNRVHSRLAQYPSSAVPLPRDRVLPPHMTQLPMQSSLMDQRIQPNVPEGGPGQLLTADASTTADWTPDEQDFMMAREVPFLQQSQNYSLLELQGSTASEEYQLAQNRSIAVNQSEPSTSTTELGFLLGGPRYALQPGALEQAYRAPVYLPPPPSHPNSHYGGPPMLPLEVTANQRPIFDPRPLEAMTYPPSYHQGGSPEYLPSAPPFVAQSQAAVAPGEGIQPNHSLTPMEYGYMKAMQTQELNILQTIPPNMMSNHYVRGGRKEPNPTDPTVLLPSVPRTREEDLQYFAVFIPLEYAEFLFFEPNFGMAGPYLGPENGQMGVMRCIRHNPGGAVVFIREDGGDIVEGIGRFVSGGRRRQGRDDTDPHRLCRFCPDKNNSYITFKDLELAQSFVRSLSSDGLHVRLADEPCLDDCNVFIHNLPDVVTMNELLADVAAIGIVDELCLGRSKFGVQSLNAFLRMATVGDAKRATRYFNGNRKEGFECVAVVGYRFVPPATHESKIAMIDIRVEFLGYTGIGMSYSFGVYRPATDEPPDTPETNFRRSDDQYGRHHHHRRHHHHHHRHRRQSGRGDVGGSSWPPIFTTQDLSQELILVSRGSIGSLEQPSDSGDEFDDTSPAGFVVPSRQNDHQRCSVPLERSPLTSAPADTSTDPAGASAVLDGSESNNTCMSNLGSGICSAAERARMEGSSSYLDNPNLSGGVPLDMKVLRGCNLMEPAFSNLLRLYLETAALPPPRSHQQMNPDQTENEAPSAVVDNMAAAAPDAASSQQSSANQPMEAISAVQEGLLDIDDRHTGQNMQQQASIDEDVSARDSNISPGNDPCATERQA